jgi:hypothetical protein
MLQNSPSTQHQTLKYLILVSVIYNIELSNLCIHVHQGEEYKDHLKDASSDAFQSNLFMRVLETGYRAASLHELNDVLQVTNTSFQLLLRGNIWQPPHSARKLINKRLHKKLLDQLRTVEMHENRNKMILNP